MQQAELERALMTLIGAAGISGTKNWMLTLGPCSHIVGELQQPGGDMKENRALMRQRGTHQNEDSWI